MDTLFRLITQADGLVNRDTLLRELANDVAGTLDIDMVTVWTIPAEGTSMTCVACTSADGKELQGVTILRSSCPEYFDTLFSNNLIQADDVYTHDALHELVDSYFKPNGVLSLLDYVLYDVMTPLLVVCCETTRAKREWQKKDVDYVKDRLMFVRPYIRPENSNSD